MLFAEWQKMGHPMLAAAFFFMIFENSLLLDSFDMKQSNATRRRPEINQLTKWR